MTSPGRFRHIDGGVRRSWPRLKAGGRNGSWLGQGEPSQFEIKRLGFRHFAPPFRSRPSY
jgi:hypothetical protein